MMWPAWLRRRKPAPNPHIITITIDTSAFVAAMEQAAAATRAMSVAMRAPVFAQALARITREFADQQRTAERVRRAINDTKARNTRLAHGNARADQVYRAGLEARWYVRGGMDPAYAHPDARDHMVRDLAGIGCHTYAAEFIRGWVTHHEETG